MKTKRIIVTLVSLLIAIGTAQASVVYSDISTPLDIANCVLWLKADTGVQTNASGLVTNWVDQSTSGYDLSQTNTAWMPSLVSGAFNGKPAVSFEKGASTADSDYLKSSELQLSNPCTLFFVMKPDNLPADRYQRFAGHYSKGQFRFDSGKANLAYDSNNAILNTPLMTAGKFDLLLYRVNDSVDMGINQYQLTRTRSSGMTFSTSDFILGGVPNIYAGSSEYGSFDGDIAEVIIYNRQLSATDINRVGYYLAQRYGIFGTDYISLQKLPADIYDFESLNGSAYPGTVLNGQDNWVHSGSDTDKATVRNDTTSNTANLPAKNREQLKRINDSTWSFSIPTNSLEVILQYYVRIGNETGGGWNRATEVAIWQNDGTSVFKPGFDGYSSNKWRLRDVGTTYLSSSVATTTGDEFKYLKCVLDLVDRDGEGSATMYESTDGTNWTPIAGLLCKDVTLKTRGVDDTSKWDTLFIDIQNGAQIDDITIQAILIAPNKGTMFIVR